MLIMKIKSKTIMKAVWIILISLVALSMVVFTVAPAFNR